MITSPSMPTAAELLPLLPELVLIGGAFALLILDLFIDARHKVWTHFLSVLVLVVVLAMLATGQGGQGTVMNGMFVRDTAADVMKLAIVLALARRSDMFLVKSLAVIFIEFIRGVPLITSVLTCPSSRPRMIMQIALSSEPEASTTAPITIAASTSHCEARSASSCAGALEFCAVWTSLMICASAVSLPILVAV